MKILGISAFYHDSAAVLLDGEKIVAAAQEERFSRIKHDAEFPFRSILYCLEQGNVELEQIDHIVFYDKPFLKFERLLETYLAFAPKGFASFQKALPIWAKEKLFQKQLIRKSLKQISSAKNWYPPILFSRHHQAHAASAFYPSPFEKAIILTMDGVGEWATSSVAVGNKNRIELKQELHFPHSLGLLYSAFTYFCGFKVNSGEYKLMGLAPYGSPKYKELIYRHLIEIKEDGSFHLNMKYFNYCTGLTMTNKYFDHLFGLTPRLPEHPLLQEYMDLAASIQAVTEEIIIKICRRLRQQFGIENLCLAGGVALNCVANGKLLQEKIFDQIWIQPAAGDAGGALGAAQLVLYQYLGKQRTVDGDKMNGCYLGPSFAQSEIEARLNQFQTKYTRLSEDELVKKVCLALKTNQSVGWFQGRMEFGPRALGNRSILGNAQSEKTQETLNLKIKFRESFRPFAPSIMSEHLSDWFDLDQNSPYMLLVGKITQSKRLAVNDQNLTGLEKLKLARSQIPAVTHVDYSARVQTVEQKSNPLYYKLLKTYHQHTHCPVLVNTSFNVRGEPIVCTPEDALNCFYKTNLDLLAIGNCLVEKS